MEDGEWEDEYRFGNKTMARDLCLCVVGTSRKEETCVLQVFFTSVGNNKRKDWMLWPRRGKKRMPTHLQ